MVSESQADQLRTGLFCARHPVFAAYSWRGDVRPRVAHVEAFIHSAAA
jgi:hypothetical protein